MINGFGCCHNQKCVTIFSAQNYCYKCKNKGGIAEISGKINLRNFIGKQRVNERNMKGYKKPDNFL